VVNINFYTIKVRLLVLAIIILAEDLILLLPHGRTSSVMEGCHFLAVVCIYPRNGKRRRLANSLTGGGTVVVHNSCTAAFGSMSS